MIFPFYHQQTLCIIAGKKSLCIKKVSLFALMTMIFLIFLGMFIGRVGSWLQKKPTVSSNIHTVAGSVILLLGIRLLIPQQTRWFLCGAIFSRSACDHNNIDCRYRNRLDYSTTCCLLSGEDVSHGENVFLSRMVIFFSVGHLLYSSCSIIGG